MVNCANVRWSCLWILANLVPAVKGLKGLKHADEAAGGARAADKAADHTKALDDVIHGACSFFSGDTEILMADGTHQPIKDVRVGDLVLATDPQTGEHGPRRVTAVWVHLDTVMDLVTEDGGRVTTTEDHPYYNTTDKTWQRADQLTPGDTLHTADGQPVRVAGLRPGTAHTTTAYNLTIHDIHTYYVVVGSAEVLVHNNDECGVYIPGGNAADFALDELAQLTHQHIGAGDLPGRPSLEQIRQAMSTVPTRLPGQNAVQFEHEGVRVIINEENPLRSTAYFPGK